MKIFRLLLPHIICLAAFLFTLLPIVTCGQDSGAESLLKADDLQNGKVIELNKRGWKYQAGDEMAWAAKDFNDGDWALIESSRLSEEDFNSIAWSGRAWFRLRVQVDESLVDQPVALRVWHWGASEIYIDGNLVKRFGKIESDTDEEFNPRGLFVPVVFTSSGAHTIAVRYSFMAARDLTQGRGRWLAGGDYSPRFSLAIASGADAASNLYTRARADRLEYIFIGLFFALALVHFLLFAFYPRERGNLFYSLFVAGLAATLWLSRLTNTGDFSATVVFLGDIARDNVQSLGVISLLAFLYVEFVGRVSRFAWVLLTLWLVGVVLYAAQIPRASLITPVMLVITLADSLRIVARALIKRRTGAWIVASGVGVLVVCVSLNIATGHGFINLPAWLAEIIFSVTVLSVPLAVSFYLARNFARTNTNLEAQLTQVKELSEKEAEHQRQEARFLVVEAENERRAKELEEARELQLSMLPKSIPQLHNLEIAAYMKPATEVGGDYYDFYVGDDGTLTVAIGDATGHGLKAGTVVTATKGLFNAFASEPSIPRFFTQTSIALKSMNLRSLYMSMALIKIKDGRLVIGGAGMPPALLFRHATAEVEELTLSGAPLGSLTSFAYREREYELSSGDTVLLMSDGFAERFNERDEMFDDERTRLLLAKVAHEDSQTIINRFVDEGDAWAGTRPQDDDVTFVVLKVKKRDSVA